MTRRRAWAGVAPHYAALAAQPLTAAAVPAWLRHWSDVRKVVWEGWTGVKAAQEHDLTDDLEETLIATLPAFALADAFQHWAYAEAPPDAGPAETDAAWQRLTARFTPWVDWTGLEPARDAGWQRGWSLFLQPFYDLTYVIAMVGALQVWRAAHTDRAGTWHRYRTALALGSTRSLPELFAAVGARWPFERSALREVVALLEATLSPSPA